MAAEKYTLKSGRRHSTVTQSNWSVAYARLWLPSPGGGVSHSYWHVLQWIKYPLQHIGPSSSRVSVDVIIIFLVPTLVIIILYTAPGIWLKKKKITFNIKTLFRRRIIERASFLEPFDVYILACNHILFWVSMETVVLGRASTPARFPVSMDFSGGERFDTVTNIPVSFSWRTTRLWDVEPLTFFTTGSSSFNFDPQPLNLPWTFQWVTGSLYKNLSAWSLFLTSRLKISFFRGWPGTRRAARN